MESFRLFMQCKQTDELLVLTLQFYLVYYTNVVKNEKKISQFLNKSILAKFIVELEWVTFWTEYKVVPIPCSSSSHE